MLKFPLALMFIYIYIYVTSHVSSNTLLYLKAPPLISCIAIRFDLPPKFQSKEFGFTVADPETSERGAKKHEI